MSDETRQSWDHISGRLHSIPVYPQRIRYALVVDAVSHLPRSARILEAGCGTGRVLRALAAKGYHNTVGQDISHAALVETAALGPEGARLVCSEDMPFASETFDAVISPGVIEHVRNPQRWVAELARVVRPGGRVAITSDTYMWAWLQRLGLYRTLQPIDNAIWPTTLVRLGEAANLKSVAYGAFINTPAQRGYFFKQLPRLLPRFGRQYRRRLHQQEQEHAAEVSLEEETRIILESVADLPDYTFSGLWACIWSYETYFWFEKAG